MKSNVDQFLSHDPAEVTWDKTFTATVCSAAQAFETQISVKVHKVQAKNKVHKVRTSQL